MVRSVPARSWWAIGAIAASVAAIGVYAALGNYPRESWSLGGPPGYYSYGPASQEPQEIVAESPEPEEPGITEPDGAEPEPVPATNGGTAHYTARAELNTLDLHNAVGSSAGKETWVGDQLWSDESGEFHVLTGVDTGNVDVTVRVLEREPATLDAGWEEAAEMSFRALPGAPVALRGTEPEASIRRLDAQGAGWYRVRVHSTGRSVESGNIVEDSSERYLILTWPAPESAPVVLRALPES